MFFLILRNEFAKINSYVAPNKLPQRVAQPPPQTFPEGMRDAPLRMSAWEAYRRPLPSKSSPLG